MKFVVFVGMVVSLVTLRERFGGLPGKWEYTFPEGVASTLGNPNKLGAYMAVLFPFSLWQTRKKWGWIFPPFILFALLLSRSEGAYLSLLFAFLLWSFIYYPQKRVVIFSGGIFLLCSLFFLFRFIPPHSFYWRLFHWEVGGRIFLSHPFIGAGLGGVFRDYPVLQAPLRLYFPFPPTSLMEKYLHNDFLQILCETGIVGFFLFYFPFIFITRFYLRIKKSPEKFIAFSLLTWLMLSMVSFPLYMPSATLLVLLSSFLYLPRKEIKINFSFPGKLTLILLLFILLFPLFSLNRILIGEYHFRKGIFYLEK
ncbi:O-antigen ligase family protein, partial [Candidatus Calescamantes bacterium]|nr:O-antigen ligase family protein [Candidatus Calescamantes bacterium]